MRVLLAPVDDEVLAVELANALEVVPLPLVTPLPSAPPTVYGLVTLRGEVVAVLDSARLLGRRGGAATHAVVVSLPGGRAAITATAAPVSAELGDLVPGSGSAHGAWHRLADGGLALLVDPARWVPAALGTTSSGGPP